MSAYLSDYKDFYNGEHTRFGLTNAIAKAGGTIQHINLFNFLLTPTFSTLDLQTNKRIAFFDSRAAQSMLFLLEPTMQILLTGLFKSEDINCSEYLKELEGNYYQTTYNIPSVTEVLSVNNAITKLNVGRIFLSSLREPLSKDWEQRMKFILCIKSNKDLLSSKDRSIEQKIRRLAEVTNSPSPYIDPIIQVARTNDRINAAIYIGEQLYYPQACIQAIVNIIELWQLSNT